MILTAQAFGIVGKRFGGEVGKATLRFGIDTLEILSLVFEIVTGHAQPLFKPDIMRLKDENINYCRNKR